MRASERASEAIEIYIASECMNEWTNEHVWNKSFHKLQTGELLVHWTFRNGVGVDEDLHFWIFSDVRVCGVDSINFVDKIDFCRKTLNKHQRNKKQTTKRMNGIDERANEKEEMDVDRDEWRRRLWEHIQAQT